MSYWIGIYCLIAGTVHLVLNEPVVQYKRWMKPWWRDDENPTADRELADALRVMTYVAAIVLLEFGRWLTDFSVLSMPVRIAVYLSFGLLAVFVRSRIIRARDLQ